MKNLVTAVRTLLTLTLLTGVLYPLIVLLLGQALFRDGAGGSLLQKDGRTVGSRLIAQGFASPKYFWPRPSAVKYDAASSGASNLGVTSADWVAQARQREQAGAVVEMRFASGSGLDPEISLTAARSQIARVAAARNLSEAETSQLRTMVQAQVRPRQFGILGEPRINVLTLNLALDSWQRR